LLEQPSIIDEAVRKMDCQPGQAGNATFTGYKGVNPTDFAVRKRLSDVLRQRKRYARALDAAEALAPACIRAFEESSVTRAAETPDTGGGLLANTGGGPLRYRWGAPRRYRRGGG
jgi:hypothetical protein